jgi:hypothetical protein
MVKKLNRVPKGYIKTIGATTAPTCYQWYNNGKSRFSGKRKLVLVKVRGCKK